jgi:hypothetical protein
MNIHKNYLIALCIAVLAGSAFFFFMHNNIAQAPVQEGTQTDQNDAVPQLEVSEYGEVELGIGEKAIFENLQIRPLSIEEDSRCPSDVQCIQAGTVRASVEIVSAMGTSTNTLSLGEAVTTEAETITLVSASPVPISTAHIPTSAYELTFEVLKREEVTLDRDPAPVEKKEACYVGGCSSQLCSDQPDMASTCEYREEYACYQTATCERQSTGECGWTQTQELNACLLGASALRL